MPSLILYCDQQEGQVGFFGSAVAHDVAKSRRRSDTQPELTAQMQWHTSDGAMTKR